jgi:excinuclease ABC subunit C
MSPNNGFEPSTFDAKTFLKNLTTHPGVYQMRNSAGDVLYVGKARNLKKRVSSYFQRISTDRKTQSMVQQIAGIEIILTHSENEALLLESNLIKQLKPRYNILLRDDKSYPYLFLSDQEDFPQLDFHRGAKSRKGRYFGPYPSAGSVRETLALLQKLFKIRQCNDHFFRSRTRPCIQYQIKRCTAPCVGYIDKKTYQQNVHYAVLFLEGKNETVIKELADKMEQASAQLDYEQATIYRDQIVNLRQTQERQHISGGTENSHVDVIAISQYLDHNCVLVLYVRGGRVIGTKAFFPAAPADSQKEEVLAAFLPQYYLSPHRGHDIPKHIVIGVKLEEKAWIEEALSQALQTKIEIIDQPRGQRRQWLNIAMTNAQHSLQTQVLERSHFVKRLEALQHALNLSSTPQRLECFDVSHTLGEATVASCVVFTTEGPSNKDYRRFNITGLTPGDDYGALKQALVRRYTRLKIGEGRLPDILIIDGGKGQLKQGCDMLEELQISGVILLAIAKGPGRKAGLETIYMNGRDTPILLQPDSPALHIIQQMRDEAHRFAITAHRGQRAKARTKSTLEEIEGVGPKRRRELLRHFGGLQEIKKASIAELAKIPGISLALAERIYNVLHS